MEKKPRERNGPTLRWTKETTAAVLNYMKKAPHNIEKPTAKVYYTKLISQNRILKIFSWEHLRNKVRNLKTKYKAALDWMNNTGVGLEMEGDNSVKEHILKLCPEFEDMDEIFGPKANISTPYLFHSDEIDSPTHETADEPLVEMNICEEESLDQSAHILDEYERQHIGDECNRNGIHMNHNTMRTSSSKAVRKRAIDNLLSYLVDVQNAKTDYYKEKLLLDNAIEEKKIKLEEEKMLIEKEKFEFEKTKYSEEIRLREIEINNRFQLEKIKLEQDLNLKAEELRLKYGSKQGSL